MISRGCRARAARAASPPDAVNGSSPVEAGIKPASTGVVVAVLLVGSNRVSPFGTDAADADALEAAEPPARHIYRPHPRQECSCRKQALQGQEGLHQSAVKAMGSAAYIYAAQCVVCAGGLLPSAAWSTSHLKMLCAIAETSCFEMKQKKICMLFAWHSREARKHAGA